MVLVRMVPVLVHARKRTFFMTETTISNTICWLFEKVRFWPRRLACAKRALKIYKSPADCVQNICGFYSFCTLIICEIVQLIHFQFNRGVST